MCVMVLAPLVTVGAQSRPVTNGVTNGVANTPLPWVQLSSGVRTLTQERRLADGLPVRIFAAEIDLCENTLGLRVSSQRPGGQTVSAYAHSTSALIAVNGDYFNLSTRRPLGPTQTRGVRWRTDAWTHHDSLVTIADDGQVQFRDVVGEGVPAMQLLLRGINRGTRDFIAAREHVLLHGQVHLSPHVEHDGRRHPRTGLGLSADGHKLWLLVIDGRSAISAGATVEELAQTLLSLGATEGLKMDGGGSSAMYIDGHGVVNHPSDGQERVVSNHLGVLRLSRAQSRPWCVGAAASVR